TFLSLYIPLKSAFNPVPHQSFQGDSPDSHMAFSSILSRRVSIGFQNPLCLYAESSCSIESCSRGSLSQIVESSLRSSKIAGSSTKKPPLTQLPSPFGFS